MAEPIYRETRFEAFNGAISDGQMPDEYVVRWEPADDLIVVTESKDETKIEFTVESFVQLVREASHLRGKDGNLLKRIQLGQL